MNKQPWWRHEAAIAWAMILVFPLGILLMWLYAPWRSRFKWMWTAIAAFFALMIVAGAAGGGGGNQNNAAHTAQEAAPTLTADEIAYIHAVSAQQAGQATALAISAEQTRAARPTSTPIPPPYKLALISSTCTRESDIGFRKCEGYVKNITNEALDDVEAVVTWVDANRTPYSTDDALIDYNPILPGQQSPWSTIGTDNPALTHFHVQFKELMGTTILTRDNRQ
jgi:hypothetical protein